MENRPLYNSLIIKTYIEFLGKYYPDLNINDLLEYAEITNYEIEDIGHWLTQKQVNLFQEYVENITKNSNISRDAGRYILSTDSSKILRNSISSFLAPYTVYWFIEKIASLLSRHLSIKSNRLAANKIELITKPLSFVKEEPFQCLNRIGMFEAGAEVFTHKYAHVEHPECIHNGGNQCRYIVSWEQPKSLIWKKIGNYALIISFISSILLFKYLPIYQYVILILGLILISLSFILYGNINYNNDLKKLLSDQGKASDKAIEQINIRYNESLLIKEIGETSARILDLKDLLNFTSSALQKHLQFKRGMLMLADPEKTKLIYMAGYGYTPDEELVIRNTNFSLSKNESRGVFHLAFHQQKPFIVDDIDNIKDDISERTMNYIKSLRVKSFICVRAIVNSCVLRI
ncbi:MAG TPA: hypothetical protein P5294_10175 [Smithellaceae bacterium]|nr:hypothetical protein [Smithellaceae bacterium]